MNPGLISLALSLVGAEAPEPFRAAVVVGVNEAFEDSQPALQYADDDAARYAELLSAHMDHLELLTVLDTDSQAQFVQTSRIARVPSVQGLSEALQRVRDRAKSARTLGRRTELYFVYIGHGRVRGGVGEVRLRDGHLDRVTLTREVLKDTAFDRKHLVVDACSAYLLVNARGEAEPDVEAAFEQFFEAQTLDNYPDVGAVLATSGVGPTHEWSRYQGGVFSHELRSALTGAADADGDGRVEYTEVEAFLAAANLEVPALKGRPRVFVQSPRIERAAALLKLEPSQPQLELPAGLSGHYILEDGRGLRYAELNKEPGYVMTVRLLPAQSYALLASDGAQLLRLKAPEGLTRLSLPLVPQPSDGWARGETAPPGVFASPFGPRFAAGFRAQWQASLPGPPGLVSQPPDAAWLKPTAGGGLMVAGAVALALSIWQGRVAAAHFRDYENAFSDGTRDAAQAAASAARVRTAALAVGAGLGLLGGGGLIAWDFIE